MVDVAQLPIESVISIFLVNPLSSYLEVKVGCIYESFVAINIVSVTKLSLLKMKLSTCGSSNSLSMLKGDRDTLISTKF